MVGCIQRKESSKNQQSAFEASSMKYSGFQTKGPWIRIGEEESYDLSNSDTQIEKNNDPKGYLELEYNDRTNGNNFTFLIYSDSFFNSDLSYTTSVYEMVVGQTYTLEEGKVIQVSGVSGNGVGCGFINKFDLTPLEIIKKGNEITSFAANLVQKCGEREFTSQIRYNSTIPFDLI
ncbi:MAG: hypothetical protein ACOYL6_15910 [Bacteriovoracaceae bacterium]